MLTNAYQDGSRDGTRVVVLPKIEAVCPIIGLSIELQLILAVIQGACVSRPVLVVASESLS